MFLLMLMSLLFSLALALASLVKTRLYSWSVT